MWRLKGQHIINEKGKAIDVQNNQDKENWNVIVHNQHNGRNQKWRIRYVDTIKPLPKKGELNTEFGLYVERPFHVVSEMSKHKYLDLIGNNLVIKTPNGRRS